MAIVTIAFLTALARAKRKVSNEQLAISSEQ
jgi:hypothetical protein